MVVSDPYLTWSRAPHLLWSTHEHLAWDPASLVRGRRPEFHHLPAPQIRVSLKSEWSHSFTVRSEVEVLHTSITLMGIYGILRINVVSSKSVHKYIRFLYIRGFPIRTSFVWILNHSLWMKCCPIDNTLKLVEAKSCLKERNEKLIVQWRPCH